MDNPAKGRHLEALSDGRISEIDLPDARAFDGAASHRREEQARATRVAVLDAAHELFLEGGYAATSIKAIAKRALVSPQTIYDVFGDKASVLFAVGERVVTGRAAAEAALSPNPWAALRNEPDALERIKKTARISREIWEDGMVEFESMVFEGAASDRRLEDMAKHALEQKRDHTRRVAEAVFPPEVLRPGVTIEDLVDLMVAIDSAAVVRTLTHELGWTYAKYERWRAEIMERLFLDRPL